MWENALPLKKQIKKASPRYRERKLGGWVTVAIQNLLEENQCPMSVVLDGKFEVKMKENSLQMEKGE